MEEFYLDWINNSSYWFSKTDEIDNYITKKYSSLLEIDYTFLNPIVQIIIYDQLPRHFFRKEIANHVIDYYLQKALAIVNYYKDDDSFVNNLDFKDWMFFMLPLRHSNEKANIFYVIEKAWQLKEIPKKFLIATYEKAKFKEELLPEINEACKYNRSILDHRATTNFIKNPTYHIGNFSIISDYEYNQTIIVSLSGGVDSMICLLNMVDLYYDKYNIVAVHINYNNRSETVEEVKFLKNVCYYFNIKLYVRKISEINRNKCMKNDMRDIYESYTKKIRYNSYKSVSENPIVILGHNKDDAFENILTNITYRNKYENLTGMDIITKIDNITFIRPLLDVSKDEIYKFAKDHNISYLKNSTPDWCQRGKIRNHVVPCLNNWDSRTINGMFNLSEVLKEYDMILKNIINDFNDNQIFNIDNINLSLLYWRSGIFKLFTKYPSHKSLKSLIERLELFKKYYNKNDLHKYTKIIITRDIILEICKLKDNKAHIRMFQS